MYDNSIPITFVINDHLKELEDASRLKIKGNLLVIVSTNNKTIIFHDL